MSAIKVMTSYYDKDAHVRVETGEECTVWVKVVHEDQANDLTLPPDEARALAAALLHYAAEAER